MDPIILTDPKRFPDDEVIAGVLGKGYALWQAFFEELHAADPDIATEWRFYNDGKSWLMKATRKKKTIVWVGVHAKYFRITAYLTEKARAAVDASGLSADCKEQFATSKRYGKLIAVSVSFKKKTDIKSGLALVRLKLALK
jgi:hypothetical protein